VEKILLIGSSGHAKSIVDIVEREGRYEIEGLVDRFREPGEQTLGYQVLGRIEDLPSLRMSHSLTGVMVAIGDNVNRSKVAARVRAVCPDLSFVSAIHPNASIARDVFIGEGTVIMAGVVINSSCSIGQFCILNTNSSLDHDSLMEDFSSLAPGVTTGGNCRIGVCTAVCIGATLSHNVHIGEHTVIGAGSTVLNDLGSFCVAYGTPAVEVRKRNPGDSYL
jgi:sugar O-acyltransferase (sialic acid O-acetyltransferase NeuD family)